MLKILFAFVGAVVILLVAVILFLAIVSAFLRETEEIRKKNR